MTTIEVSMDVDELANDIVNSDQKLHILGEILDSYTDDERKLGRLMSTISSIDTDLLAIQILDDNGMYIDEYAPFIVEHLFKAKESLDLFIKELQKIREEDY